MVVLAARLATLYQSPFNNQPEDGQDLYSLGRTCETLGLASDGEQAYLHALNDSLSPSLRDEIEQQLSLLYKRARRWEEANVLWEQLRASTHGSIFACIELAKYHEHHTRNYSYALALALEAYELRLANPYVPGPTLAELNYRVTRLRRKLMNQTGEPPYGD